MSFCAGGLIQGRAYGNAFNFVDASLMDQPPIVGGQILLYNSHEDPANLTLISISIMGFSHDITDTIQPVFQNVVTALTYMIALINHRPDWFLDKLLGLLNTNRFISVHFTMIYRQLKCSGVSLKKLRWIVKENTALRRLAFLMSFRKMSAHSISIVVVPKRGNVR